VLGISHGSAGGVSILKRRDMRKDIEFKTTDGTTLRGWHYLPDGSGKHATIVRHGAWLLGREGNVSRQIRRCLR
jgi:predicted acyl esterase